MDLPRLYVDVTNYNPIKYLRQMMDIYTAA